MSATRNGLAGETWQHSRWFWKRGMKHEAGGRETRHAGESFMLSDHRPASIQAANQQPLRPLLPKNKKKKEIGEKGETMGGGWRRTPSQTRASLSNSNWRLYAWLHSAQPLTLGPSLTDTDTATGADTDTKALTSALVNCQENASHSIRGGCSYKALIIKAQLGLG